MVQSQYFKRMTILLGNDLPAKDRDKIPAWINHAGGKLAKELTDDVTHYVISRDEWEQYPETVKLARGKGTIFLVKFDWLKNSLTPKSGKRKGVPLEEVQKQYVYELKHAQRVRRKRKDMKMRLARERAKAKKFETQLEDANPQGDASDAEEYGIRTPKKDLAQQFAECGMKFNKTILESERKMALEGYRPYINPQGFVHVITLVRQDVLKTLQETYQLRVSDCDFNLESVLAIPRDAASSRIQSTLNKIASNDRLPSVRSLLRATLACPSPTFATNIFSDPKRSQTHQGSESIFQVNKNTQPHYLRYEICCRSTGWVRYAVENPGRSQMMQEGRLPSRTTAIVEPGLPFSIRPLYPYSADIGSERVPVYARHVQPYIYIPRPYAYSLQLYESYEPSSADSYVRTPDSTSSSECPFEKSYKLSYAAVASIGLDATQTPTRTQTPDSNHQPCHPGTAPKRKSYHLIVQYTKRGKQRDSTSEVLAPKGSTFDFAYDMLRKFFKRKTGMQWEVVTGGNTAALERRDSGVFMNGNETPTLENEGQIFASSNLNTLYQRDPFQYVPSTDANLQAFNKKYFDRFGSSWLPSAGEKKQELTRVAMQPVEGQSGPGLLIRGDDVTIERPCGEDQEMGEDTI